MRFSESIKSAQDVNVPKCIFQENKVGGGGDDDDDELSRLVKLLMAQTCVVSGKYSEL